MSQAEAVELIVNFAGIQCQLMKEANGTRGCTKRSLKEEKRLASALFFAITGQKPTEQQLSDMEIK